MKISDDACEELEKRMDELAGKYAETHDPVAKAEVESNKPPARRATGQLIGFAEVVEHLDVSSLPRFILRGYLEFG